MVSLFSCFLATLFTTTFLCSPLLATPIFTHASLQVVSHWSLLASSPIYGPVWNNLADLHATHVRFAGWFPYPHIGVAELDPPTVGFTCTPMSWAGVLGQTEPVALSCGSAGLMDGISFAAFGTPTGVCGNFSADADCNDPAVTEYVASRCLGRTACWLDPRALRPGPSCAPTSGTYFAVEATCTNRTGVVTHWNFTVMDQVFLDLFRAVEGNNRSSPSLPIISFSTAPTWLYSASSYEYPQSPAEPYYAYDKGPAALCNLTLLENYYERVFSWYMSGGFVDEAGTWHSSGHFLDFRIIEVFNEVDYEHEYNVEQYTAAFDAVVRAALRAVKNNKQKRSDPPTLQFNGMNLPNIDSRETVVAWARYFLNASNHDPECVPYLNFIGYHAYPTNGPYNHSAVSFEQMFPYVDSFVATVAAVDEVVRELSPATKTLLDECGTDMDNVLNASLTPPNDNVMYWVASGAYFAYLYGSILLLENSTVVSVGESQLMDSPGQEPSVTMLDWATGAPTARYAVLKLLLSYITVGVDTVTSSGTTAGGCFFLSLVPAGSNSSQGTRSRRLLVVNKRATLGPFPTNVSDCYALTIDNETSTTAVPRRINCTDDGTLMLGAFSTTIVFVEP